MSALKFVSISWLAKHTKRVYSIIGRVDVQRIIAITSTISTDLALGRLHHLDHAKFDVVTCAK